MNLLNKTKRKANLAVMEGRDLRHSSAGTKRIADHKMLLVNNKMRRMPK